MTKGLCLARLFHAAGHNVIGADFEPVLLPICAGRTSRALQAFYKLPRPIGGRELQAKYTRSILDVIRKENVQLWISCSGVSSAVEDGLAKETVELVTNCKAVQFDAITTQRLHEKHSFIDYTKSLNLPVPETYTVSSRAAALQVLLDDAAGTGKKYVFKYAGTDDAVRGDMTLLPLASPSLTKSYLSAFEISEDRPWILQQYIRGPEFCTHSLVVQGEVIAFVACPSSELLMHYRALPADSALSRAMLRFTQEFALAGGENFTGHLSFDFLVQQEEADRVECDAGADVKLYPIECNPRAHTAVCLFRNTPKMVEGYLSLLESKPRPPTPKSGRMPNGLAKDPIFPLAPAKYYWIGHDLVELIILPLLLLFSREGPSLQEVFKKQRSLIEHVLSWHDGTFEFWDPLPAWWLYHIYWPTQFLTALLTRGKWSRINVSTCKMFMCS
ncbi:hypothetical protein M433DRAFT_70395 [Acidomyces richmondensis BFW]|nr:MAG: hypothetical protein FE78DRAFT_154104 [Acidomyces sp. 'richmondensis']KYG44015.1 hypothetical protein M433DRAFT_70395 [Acidomyces richmondensis BFW]